jgi:hypothetical protein
MTIGQRYAELRRQAPDHVTIVLAAKTRSPDEIRAAIEAGATDIGHNYVQEAEATREALADAADRARWHMIGPLQTNKINKALKLFDVIQTVDSVRRAEAIHRRADNAEREVIPILLEINIADENAKAGLSAAQDAESLESATEAVVRSIDQLDRLRLEGLMTMGPLLDDPEAYRPLFRRTRELFEHLRRLDLPSTSLTTLSMGMTGSWKVAVDEGATMIRVGTAVFGPRAG